MSFSGWTVYRLVTWKFCYARCFLRPIFFFTPDNFFLEIIPLKLPEMNLEQYALPKLNSFRVLSTGHIPLQEQNSFQQKQLNRFSLSILFIADFSAVVAYSWCINKREIKIMFNCYFNRLRNVNITSTLKVNQVI